MWGNGYLPFDDMRSAATQQISHYITDFAGMMVLLKIPYYARSLN